MSALDTVTGELVPVEPHPDLAMTLFGTNDPDEVVRQAGKHARALAKVVEKQKLYKQIGPTKYILVEGWQLLGTTTGVFAVGEGEPEYVEIGDVAGFKATVVAMRNGDVIGRATAYCMRDEDLWSKRPTHALAAMAQTRATSRALRGPLGAIVKLAGYEATAAEEMPPVVQAAPAAASQFRAPAGVLDAPEPSTGPQQKKIHTLLTRLEKLGALDGTQALDAMKRIYGTSHTSELTKEQANELIDRLETKEKEAEAA